MPKLTIEQPHALDSGAVKQRLDQLNHSLATKYGVDSRWTSSTMVAFSRTGASGTVEVQAGKVVVKVDLAFVLSPVKDKVQARIQEELKKALVGPPA